MAAAADSAWFEHQLPQHPSTSTSISTTHSGNIGEPSVHNFFREGSVHNFFHNLDIHNLIHNSVHNLDVHNSEFAIDSILGEPPFHNFVHNLDFVVPFFGA